MSGLEKGNIRFDNRVVVVTGAGAGLGREYALLFASRGAKVVVNDLGGSFHGDGSSQWAADVVVDEIKSKRGIAVANYDSVVEGEKIIETAVKNFGRVDILINNAGILRDKSFLKMTDQDWDLVHNVHLKGSFTTTRAAWPYFRKQNYGRIIMTSSNSGIYGNFGQANYSAAKLGLIGLANTVAIEGDKYNIHCNVIVPTAASRMTEGILPPMLFDQLKPKLIAPVVAYLCHESNNDNGAVIESAAGWATKVHSVQGEGCVLRTSIEDDVTPEYVERVWGKITDMSKAKHLNNTAERRGPLLKVVENLVAGKYKEGTYEDEMTFNHKDLILYALGIGASVSNPNDLKYLYENHPEFNSIPTFFVLPGFLLAVRDGMATSSLKLKEGVLMTLLHGEQYLEICGDLPTNGKLVTRGQVYDTMDKKSGAVVVTNCETYDESGNLLIKNQSSFFLVGGGNFGGKKVPADGVVPTLPCPKRAPDTTIIQKTILDQASLYRLSGDRSPLHIDPKVSVRAGYKEPIMHGLCSFGFSVRAVLQQYANNDGSLLKCVKVRFTKPVIPGHTLKVDMWRTGKRIFFQTSVKETNQLVITGAYVDLKDVKTQSKL